MLQLKRDVKNTSAREQRAKEGLAKYIQQVKEQNLITEELENKLSAYERMNLYMLLFLNTLLCLFDSADIPVELFSSPTNGYTEDQKDFSIMLHLYSPKAYEFLRTKVSLPSPRTIRRFDL